MLKDGGKPVRSGKWQIMINGESYKVIVAEAAKKALETNRAATGEKTNHYERVFIVKLYNDAKGAESRCSSGRLQRSPKTRSTSSGQRQWYWQPAAR